MKNDQQALIAMGGNLPSGVGSRERTLRAALDRLMQLGVEIDAVSRFYETPCFPAGAGPDYVNAAARLSCGEGPEVLLGLLHQVEAEFGRERVQRWGRRTLDLDLIAVGDAVLPDAATHARWRELPSDQQSTEAPERLILPHPRVQDRAFVLVPLADVAPNWRHPVLNQTVTEMLAVLPERDKSEVRPL